MPNRSNALLFEAHFFQELKLIPEVFARIRSEFIPSPSFQEMGLTPKACASRCSKGNSPLHFVFSTSRRARIFWREAGIEPNPRPKPCASTSDRPRDLFFTRVGTTDVPNSNVFGHQIAPGTYFLQGLAPPMCQKVVCFDIRSHPGPIFYKGRRRRCVKK